MPAIETAFIDPGNLRYVFFDFALDPRHEHAARAAEAAHCANDQERFWAYRGRLFDSDNLAGEALLKHAKSVGLDTIQFQQCLNSARYRSKTEADRALSRKLRVRGTPSFFLGKSNADGERVEIVKRISGARPFALFSEHLETLNARITGEDPRAISISPPSGPQQ
jgi:protein-disulfide isomerase